MYVVVAEGLIRSMIDMFSGFWPERPGPGDLLAFCRGKVETRRRPTAAAAAHLRRQSPQFRALGPAGPHRDN